MLTSDIVLISAIVLFVIFWWGTTLPARFAILALAAIAALAAGAYGVFVDRWQAGVGTVAAAILLGVVVANRLRGSGGKSGLPWLSGLLFTLFAAVSIAAIWFFPIPQLPAPSGEYIVGVRDFELVDENRVGVFSAAPDEPRRLLVRVWYPAEKSNGGEPRPYFKGKEVDAAGGWLGGDILNAPFFFKYVRHVRTNSYEDAPLKVGAKGFPVIFFSHGYSSFLGQNTALMEELASEGYIVYSVNHTFDSADAVMPNGEVLERDPALREAMLARAGELDMDMINAVLGGSVEERYTSAIKAHEKALASGDRLSALSAPVWLADRLFVHDALQRGAAPENVAEIVAASDFAHTGEMGMSFGGSTSGAVCMVDRRCAAGVNLDGQDIHFAAFARNIPVPFLIFYSDLDEQAASIAKAAGIELPEGDSPGFNDLFYERPETAGLRSDVYRLRVKGATHIGVSDFPLFMRRPLRDMFFGATPSHAMIAIQRDFVREFFDKHLRGIASGFPEETFAAHAEWVMRDDVSDVREEWIAAHPEDKTVEVVLETDLGYIEFAIYPERAPISAANFLAYVDRGLFDGASFYRVTKKGEGSALGVVQGGLLGEEIKTETEAEIGSEAPPLPPISLETTQAAGMINERGVISMARGELGTAASEFFVNIDDNPSLDIGAEISTGVVAGHAPFGRVLRGMRILEEVQQLPADGPTAIPFLSGQILSEPVTIRRAYRSAEKEKRIAALADEAPQEEGLAMGAGVAAKLACSGVFVSGFSLERIASDINRLQPPVTEGFEYSVDKAHKTVRARKPSIERTALYRPGVGCTLLVDTDVETLERQAKGIEAIEMKERRKIWPAGDEVDLETLPADVDAAALSKAIDDIFAADTPDYKIDTRALAVIHGGRIIAERYAEGYSKYTRFLGWSASKSVTAALVGALVTEGKLSLDAPAPVEVWSGADDPRHAITLRNLLNMSSGLAFTEKRYLPGEDSTIMLFERGDMAGYAAERPMERKPNEVFHYSSGTTNILARIVFDATGGTLAMMERFARDHFFLPAGMTSAVFERDATGTMVGSSSFYATARDWARFGLLHLNRGKLNGKQILSPEWVSFVRTAALTTDKYGGHFWLNGVIDKEKGVRVFPDLPADAYFALGHNTQIVGVFPSRNVVIVRLGWTTGEAKFDTNRRFSAILSAIGE